MNHRTLTMTNLLNLTHTTRQRSSSSTSRLPLAWHDQRIVLGFAEPDPNSKIYCALTPAKAGLRSDQRAPSSAPFKGNAVLEYGPTEILPPTGANWKTLRVSADPVAKPAALTRAESRGSRHSKILRERDRLSAGGIRIRTIGPPSGEPPF